MGNLKWVEYGIEKDEHEPVVWFRVRAHAPLFDPTKIIDKAYEAFGKDHSQLRRQTQKYRYYDCPLWFAPVLFDTYRSRFTDGRMALVLPGKLSQVIVCK